MTKIREHTTYTVDGLEGRFGSLKAVREAIESEIGKIIDKTSIPLGPREKLAVLDAILGNRKDMSRLLNATFDLEVVSDSYTENRNIFDLDL
jgi:hypothetical protein